MEIKPQIFYTKILHKRYTPKPHKFIYNHYYLALPIATIHDNSVMKYINVNRPGILSFYEDDHTIKNTDPNKPILNIQEWVLNILKLKNLEFVVKDIMLITMPRVLGHNFNPVSFWLCFDQNKKLIAVICEVNNTFGEGHNYLCVKPCNKPINKDEYLVADKIFHVSPFFTRDGLYKFRFLIDDDKIGLWIKYDDESNNNLLLASLTGTLKPLTKTRLFFAFIRYPFITLKTIFFIHWQAFILYLKGIKYCTKPEQKKERMSVTNKVINIKNGTEKD